MPAPDPPDAIPAYVADALDRQGPQTLRTIADYADRLAAHKENAQQQALEAEAVDQPQDAPRGWDQDDWDDIQDDAQAPAKATLTTKTIDGRDYYYYQWREGDTIKSEYLAPVTPAGSE